MTNFEQTRAFHEACGLPVAERPELVTPDRRHLRIKLLREETAEATSAMRGRDLAAIAKELADVLSVVYGAALEYGIPMDAVYAAVNASNIAKAGGPIRADGKQLKPEGWQAPDLAPILAGS